MSNQFYIAAIIDTRQVEEVEKYGKTTFKPVPGTGDESICAVCGKSHEVLYYVQRVGGQVLITGKTCAKRLGATNQTWNFAYSKSTKFDRKRLEIMQSVGLTAQ